MKEELKLRINKIDNSEVPKGYKSDSKLGIIPSDWESVKFKDILKVNQGLQIPITSRLKEHITGSYFYITNEFLKNRDKGGEEYYILNPSKSVVCSKDDILMTRTGNTGIVLTNVEGAFHNNFFKINFDRKKINKEFLFYYLNSQYVKKMIKIYAGSSTIPDLNHSDFYKIHFPMMNYSEQHKIASVLSTWDKAIELKEKLIEQKKEQKKGLMQKLLTGEVRLPGYRDTWKKVDFEEVFIRIPVKKNQIKTNEYLQNGKFPVVDQGKQKIIAYSNDEEKVYHVDNGVIIFGDHTRELKFIDFDFIVGADGTQVLDTNNGYNKKFYYYSLLHKKIPNTGYNRHFKFLKEMWFYKPSLKEQLEIAELLWNADKEINLISEELEIMKLQKQGLMQQLLTGKIRVKI